MIGYEGPVRPAVDAMESLKREILNDLDEGRGGISWWSGHLDARRSALLGEYLLASCTGVEDSLIQASYAIETYKSVATAQDFARRDGW